jgi:hypothetical protein
VILAVALFEDRRVVVVLVLFEVDKQRALPVIPGMKNDGRSWSTWQQLLSSSWILDMIKTEDQTEDNKWA